MSDHNYNTLSTIAGCLALLRQTLNTGTPASPLDDELDRQLFAAEAAARRAALALLVERGEVQVPAPPVWDEMD